MGELNKVHLKTSSFKKSIFLRCGLCYGMHVRERAVLWGSVCKGREEARSVPWVGGTWDTGTVQPPLPLVSRCHQCYEPPGH